MNQLLNDEKFVQWNSFVDEIKNDWKDTFRHDVYTIDKTRSITR